LLAQAAGQQFFNLTAITASGILKDRNPLCADTSRREKGEQVLRGRSTCYVVRPLLLFGLKILARKTLIFNLFNFVN
jgi:hypothetical protein